MMIIENINKLRVQILRNILKLVQGDVKNLITIDNKQLNDIQQIDTKENKLVWACITKSISILFPDNLSSIESIPFWQQIERGLKGRQNTNNFAPEFINWLQPISLSSSSFAKIEMEIQAETAARIIEPLNYALLNELRELFKSTDVAYEQQKEIKNEYNELVEIHAKILNTFLGNIQDSLTDSLYNLNKTIIAENNLAALAKISLLLIYIYENIDTCKNIHDVDDIIHNMRGEIVSSSISSFKSHLYDIYTKINDACSTNKEMALKDKKNLSRAIPALDFLKIDFYDAFMATNKLLLDDSTSNTEKIQISYSALATKTLTTDLLSIWYERLNLDFDAECARQYQLNAANTRDDAAKLIEPEAYVSTPKSYLIQGRLPIELDSLPDFDESLMRELTQIFTEEALEKLIEIKSSLSKLEKNISDLTALQNIRRAFHTLKGSGRMSGMMLVGEIGWQVERVLNGCVDNTYVFNLAILSHVQNGYDAIAASLGGLDITEELYRIAFQANYLIENRGNIEDETPATELKNTIPNFNLIYEFPSKQPTIPPQPSLDPKLVFDLFDTFLKEISLEIKSIQTNISLLQENINNNELTIKLRRHFHTIKGNSRILGAMTLGEIAWNTERVLNNILNNAMSMTPDVMAFLVKSCNVIIAIRHALDSKRDILHEQELGFLTYDADYLLASNAILHADCFSLSDKYSNVINLEDDLKVPPLPPLNIEKMLSTKDIFSIDSIIANLDEDEGIGFSYNENIELNTFADKPLNLAPEILIPINLNPPDISLLMAEFEKCKAGSHRSMREFARRIKALHDYYISINAPKIDIEITNSLYINLSRFRAYGLSPNKDLLTLWGKSLEICLSLITKSVTKSDFTEAAKTDLISHLNLFDQFSEQISYTNSPDAALIIPEVDKEILAAFLAEAREILETNDDILLSWKAESYNPSSQNIPEIRRNMHTIKGGARMVERMDIGQIAHALESLLEEKHIKLFANDLHHFEILQRAMDHIGIMLERSGDQKDPETYSLLAALYVLLGNETPPELEYSGTLVAASDDAMTKVSSETTQAAQSALSALRIEPKQLQNITNGVAESTVLTNQLAKENSFIRSNMDELKSTITRLRLQARRLEIETEAQMLSRNVRAHEVPDDFDPLELDRFSEIQQLSRALLETVEDLSSLKQTITDIIDNTSLSLEKQKALQDSIVQSLTLVRTINFTTIIPRMRRLLRQVSLSVGKKIELVTEGTDIQIERTILEQLVPPLEHIIRNAAFHGIETPQERIDSGKPETGVVKIKISRDGAKLLLVISDDGRGFNLDKIKEKALSQGFIKENDLVDEHALTQIVLLPGFTTTTEITENAGRGVGLDVLNSALKVLHAKIDIENTPYKGLKYNIHIPFSLTVTDALIIRSGDISYTIPLMTIEAVGIGSQIIINEDGTRIYSYDTETYTVYSLAECLNKRSTIENYENAPIILIKSGERRIAIEIDEIISHQEIIVRPLNPQLAEIQGISGASVMPDGSLIFTLDLSNLILTQINKPEKLSLTKILANASNDQEGKEHQEHPEYQKDKEDKEDKEDKVFSEIKPLILVVDDSITMRKVSTRMLERAGFRIITAKDGLDALERLGQEQPDLIMLDIEMPRMDGFEVLANVRSNQSTTNIPIIMITSRTGEKHRQRALSLGANEYCGKPYQEAQMLALIRKLIQSQ
ncbi:hypothetical protein AwWohl_03870 [Gammaproteobacteria bacterium]|nr:hypothetical protein AwWohl_03870 [Gammaproteobacteria bacterium]